MLSPAISFQKIQITGLRLCRWAIRQTIAGIYIVDEACQLKDNQQKIDQIVVTGMHVCPCYQNNLNAKQQKFCQLSINGHSQLAYLTGDIGHYDNQGHLNYLERRDHQVKINGYRVECGQLETLLLESGYFHSVAVTAHQGELFAYLRLKSREYGRR